MKRLKLKFMVVPEELGSKAYVPDSVKLRIIRPDALLFDGITWR
jgi:hypothetical protein